MHDIQNDGDDRGIPIDRVGVCDLRYPIAVLDRHDRRQSTTGRWSLAVDLAPDVRGTHMSRFVEVLHAHRDAIALATLPAMLGALQRKLRCDHARIDVSFPYFAERAAPVSGAVSLMDYQCGFSGELNGAGCAVTISVAVPVTSLCPCSKAISDYGAHNQRGQVDIAVGPAKGRGGCPQPVWIEDLIDVAEASASSPVYALLKRPDERHVTMEAYDHPVFVEDLVRNVALRLQADERVASFRVRALNQESIHNHNAFAEVAWSRR